MTKRGIALIVIGIALIISLFVVDKVASNQVSGPPYINDYDPDLRENVRYPTFHLERGEPWVQTYYKCDKFLWGFGLAISAALIYFGARQKKAKSSVQ